MTRRPRVGVVGASARALVHSLARAGIESWAVDLFADRDLARVAPCATCPSESYPNALPNVAAQFPSGPILYTGGLENHPDVVAQLAATRELWGNPPEVLARVRDPFTLKDVLWTKAFAYPRLAEIGSSSPMTGRWLRKPLRSAGGTGIRFAQAGEAPSQSQYFQEFVDGRPMSVVFVANHPRQKLVRLKLVGVTEQLIGEPWLHARQFGYAGNVGPAELTSALHSELMLLGYRLVIALGVRGVFGVDFVLHDGHPWVIEVNPRYTASVEVIEHATGRAVFAPPSLLGKGTGGLGSSTIGKAIYYAPHRITFPQSGPWDADLSGDFDPWRLPGFADIPHPGAVIEPGWPVLTYFASGSSPAECRERLQSRASELDSLFAKGTP